MNSRTASISPVSPSLPDCLPPLATLTGFAIDFGACAVLDDPLGRDEETSIPSKLVSRDVRRRVRCTLYNHEGFRAPINLGLISARF